ncbi:MAG: hypothetical protein WC438_05930 [Candidatus Pacearchaeota archaeon]|jgi:hypothetical protein
MKKLLDFLYGFYIEYIVRGIYKENFKTFFIAFCFGLCFVILLDAYGFFQSFGISLVCVFTGIGLNYIYHKIYNKLPNKEKRK